MKVILLSGGSGKRLWPLSNNIRSKQFLKLLDDNNGSTQSMIQRIWEQLTKLGLEKSTFIAAGTTQVDVIREQISQDASIIVEPECRDTFPAVTLAITYLISHKMIDLNEVVCFIPVDIFVELDFFKKLVELEHAINNSNSHIALLGVEPLFPSQKYGYILPQRTATGNIFQVIDRFIEKPKLDVADWLIGQGALWNCGVFAVKPNYFIDLLEKGNYPSTYEDVQAQYSKLPCISVDYKITQNADRSIVIPYNKQWKDLGTWNTLTEEMKQRIIGMGIISGDSQNTHIINELDIPVAVLGLSNIVVAVGSEGILISDKDSSVSLKELLYSL